jgi:hypothetical protein
LSRIKFPEQLKTCKVGELGKLISLDRVPEAKCLRRKIEQIVNQEKAEELSKVLCHEWMDKEEPAFFYIDDHVRVYHGSLANLPKRNVSREKLCLAGTTEFWVNNELGLPYMVVTEVRSSDIINALLHSHRAQQPVRPRESGVEHPVCHDHERHGCVDSRQRCGVCGRR